MNRITDMAAVAPTQAEHPTFVGGNANWGGYSTNHKQVAPALLL